MLNISVHQRPTIYITNDRVLFRLRRILERSRGQMRSITQRNIRIHSPNSRHSHLTSCSPCLRVSVVGVALFAFILSGCKSKLPEKGSKEYVDAVSTFYVGLSALQVGDDVHAESKLSQLTQAIPGEPAVWVNWAILALRQRNFEAAAQRLEQARKLAPQNDQIYYLLGVVEGGRNHPQDADRDLRKAIEINPRHLRAAYQLAQQ